jgi:hypothetical protein
LYVPIINGRKYSYQYHEILAKLQQKKLHTDHEGEIAKKKQHPQDSARIQVPSDPKKKSCLKEQSDKHANFNVEGK